MAVGFAITISELSAWIDTTAAVMLAAGSLLLLAKDTLNWRQGVVDEFAENSAGLAIGHIFGPLHLVGIVLATVAVLSGI